MEKKARVIRPTENSPLSLPYLDGHSGKSDLLKRLHTILEALSSDDLDLSSSEASDLPALVEALAEDKYLCHREKDVRLICVLACMEIFYLYAPSPPWAEDKILKIFAQVIRQLANLAVCTTPSQPNFLSYLRLLERLATVKIGVVLVELTRTLESNGHSSSSGELPSSDDALELLCELVRTILVSVSIDHPPDVSSYAVSAICACIDEFDSGIPIAILDELLLCISLGPVVFVTNPAFVEASAAVAQAKKKGKPIEAIKLPPTQIQQTNHSYMVAATVIRKTQDRISTSVSYLLNGLLTSDSNVMKRTNISSSDALVPAASENNASTSTQQPSDVWTIIYELHRISSSILTTVIGTVATLLDSSNSQIRLRVTKLLGRLFNSSSSNIALQYHSCFREWIHLSADADQNIRLCVAKNLISMLCSKNGEKQLCKDATDTLTDMIKSDASVDVRLLIVHEVCDLVYRQKTDTADDTSGSMNGKNDSRLFQSASSGNSIALVSSRLLKAVGNRVSSKNKTERRDAVFGLAQIYFRRYVLEKLKKVNSGGDDCEIDLVVETVAEVCKIKCEKDRRRPTARLATSHDDKEYFDLDEKYSFIPRLVFESICFTDSVDPEMRSRVIQIVDEILLGSFSSDNGNKSSSLSVTSRAIGLMMILHSFKVSDTGEEIPIEESNAYKWLCSLLLQRAKLQQAVSAYIETRTNARDAARGSDAALALETAALAKLEAIVRLCPPTGSCSSSSTSCDDKLLFSQSFHAAKDKHIFRLLSTIATPTHTAAARSRAMDELPKRANSLGAPVALWLKELVRRCAMGGFINIDVIIKCIQLAQEAFQSEEYAVASSFLSSVKLLVHLFPSIVGTKVCFASLVELFGSCIETNSSEVRRKVQDYGLLTTLSGLLALATSSRQSAVMSSSTTSTSTPSSDDEDIDQGLRLQLVKICTKTGSAEQARLAVVTLAAMYKDELTSSVSADDNNEHKSPKSEDNVFVNILKTVTSPSQLTLSLNGKDNDKIMTVLATLSALVEVAPNLFIASSKNRKGEFAINFAFHKVIMGNDNDNSINIGENKERVKRPSSLLGSNPKSPESEMHSKASSKGRVYEQLSLSCRRLCAAIDFMVSYIRSTTNLMKQKKLSWTEAQSHNSSWKERIATTFDVLIYIINSSGRPPSARDRTLCQGIKEMAAVRKCAALNIFRLCDRNLGLEELFFNVAMWRSLSKVFLDSDSDVRVAVMDELSDMISCSGLYRQNFSPSLRFVAYSVLCADGTGPGYGKISSMSSKVRCSKLSKAGVESCITNLRRSCETISLQCRSKSRQAEIFFDTNIKFTLMPEYVLPSTIYLLCFLKETPSAGGSVPIDFNKDDSYDDTMDDVNDQKLLRKRLKFLLEPLVQSLGDGADNISFLLRMAEVIGQKYSPLEVASFDDSADVGDEQLPHARLKVICSVIREILMKLVKKDIHLSHYPGAVNIPSSLFTRIYREPSKSSSDMKTNRLSVDSRKNGNRVHFSPESMDEHEHKILRRHLESSFLGSQQMQKESINKQSELIISPIPPSNSSDSDEYSPDVSARKSRARKRDLSRISPPHSHDSSDGQSIGVRPSTSDASKSSFFSTRRPLSDTDANTRDSDRPTSISVSIDSKCSHHSLKASGKQLKIQSTKKSKRT